MSEPLTADELAAIRERHGKLGHGPIESFSYPIQDRARLLAELERLQAQLAAVEGVCDRAERAQAGSAAMVFTGRIRAALGT